MNRDEIALRILCALIAARGTGLPLDAARLKPEIERMAAIASDLAREMTL